jgi:predicted alpha/beta superfamily hydrolase
MQVGHWQVTFFSFGFSLIRSGGMMKLAVPLLLIVLSALPLEAQNRFEQATSIGQVDSIWSVTLNEHRPFIVYTPPSYSDTTLVPGHYPVLYLLDGDAHFHSVSGLVQILGTGINGTFAVPALIVIAIPNTDRTRDLTPTHSVRGPDGVDVPAEFFASSGGGTAFLEFLRDELIPHIDAEYRTVPYRVFVGHSFGGITVLNALFTMPETFDAYVAIDPSLWWDDRVLVRRARDFFESARLDGKVLYMTQANTIIPGDTAVNHQFTAIPAFDAIVTTFDRSGIRYGFRYYREDSHGSVPLISTYDALRFVFEGYYPPLMAVLNDPSLLDEHFRRVSGKLGRTFEPSDALFRMLSMMAMAPFVDASRAVDFAEMRTARFPDHPLPFEALGDLWAANGDPARALGYYEQALARGGYARRLGNKIEQLRR